MFSRVIFICAIAISGVGIAAISGCGDSSVQTKAPSKAGIPANYPLDTCPVSGQKLGTMGDPYVIKYQGKAVALCCSKCVAEFNADPAKYMGILDAAQKKSTTGK
jgi:YHS domain-containing protein